MVVNLVQAACAKAAEVCEAQGKSIGRLALQFALRNPIIPTTLVGMVSVSEVGGHVETVLLSKYNVK
jgi:aryl-alcohol dehydrogenase-like predicted oxidoreductase